MSKATLMKSIRTAILSFGMSGRVFHAPFIALDPQFELVGIWERTSNASLEFYPNIRIYRSLEEVLEDASIDLVIVNTPTYTHYEYCKKTLLAGKHAVVEKAFTNTVEEAKELDRIASEKGLKLSVFQNRRWDSVLKTVRKVLAEKNLGENHLGTALILNDLGAVYFLQGNLEISENLML